VTLNRPSHFRIVDGAPSVEIHRFPSASNARLSGQEMGDTLSAGKPEKYVESSTDGSPATSRRFHVKVVAVWSPPSSMISTTWPSRLAVRGLGSVAPSVPALPRS